ncbi:Aste57867_8793 [Aphanomyces stellatus]|uniref:Aste57867_8793 protein n=1 Tax=Aphanomyces stellatus TaxID=120398 RepID=A0A485KLH7_9STRA|nr:hypothetical protein As57867_008758 [Aphanomyces stellatus]VFT85679.1 Aste57867_8793 [Aphanomyces stellatus]
MDNRIAALSVQDTAAPAVSSGSSSGGAQPQTNDLSVFFNVAGLYQKIVVQDGWFVGDLIKFMAKISANLHPHAEVPECNAIRNNQTRKFVALADPASRALVHGNLYDLLFVEKASKVAASVASPTLGDEIQVVFYNNPLGITIKPAGDGTMYVVATKKKELNCYRRLVPGMHVVSVGGVPLTGMDFREFHTTMASSVFPLTIVFRATQESLDAMTESASATPRATAATNNNESDEPASFKSIPPPPPPVASSSSSLSKKASSSEVGSSSSSVVSSSNQRFQGDTFNMPVPMLIHDDGTVESKVVRRASPPTPHDNNHHHIGSSSHRRTLSMSALPSATLDDEARLEEGLKSLNEAFYKKKRELNDIVDRIREYTTQLAAVRSALGKHESGGGASSLTLEMLLEKVPSRRKASGSVISNASSVTSSVMQSGQFTPSRLGYPPKTTSSKAKHGMSSSASVCSLTSTCSIDRMAFKKSKSGTSLHSPFLKKTTDTTTTTLSGRMKKPMLNTNAFSSTLNLPSSFSTKGAVIPQAQTPRGAFLNPKSITPGVGHYDVKDLTKHVKGGEIGDSDRDLTWS